MLKLRILTIVLFLLASFIFTSASFASTFTIYDTGDSAYWGGREVLGYNNGTGTPNNPIKYGDVIGDPDYALEKMDITFNGPLMTVSITGNYFQTGRHEYPVNGIGTFGPGDLYINSTGWIVTGTAASHYANDTFNEQEGWNLVVTPTGVYDLDYSKITFTNVPLAGGWYYRDSQAWKGGVTPGDSPLAAVTYYHLDNSGITYTFDTTGLGLGPKFGLHWTMRCGNDVIEGLDPVPEPATMLLLGLGLLGLGVTSRKKLMK